MTSEVKITICKPSHRYERVNNRKLRAKTIADIKGSRAYMEQEDMLNVLFDLIDERRKSDDCYQ